MTPEKLLHQPLGLGMNWEVTECIHDRDAGVVRLRVRETTHLRQSERSPGVGGPVVACDHTEELVWRHLNVFGNCSGSHPKAGGYPSSYVD